MSDFRFEGDTLELALFDSFEHECADILSEEARASNDTLLCTGDSAALVSMLLTSEAPICVQPEAFTSEASSCA